MGGLDTNSHEFSDHSQRIDEIGDSRREVLDGGTEQRNGEVSGDVLEGIDEEKPLSLNEQFEVAMGSGKYSDALIALQSLEEQGFPGFENYKKVFIAEVSKFTQMALDMGDETFYLGQENRFFI